MKAWLVRAGRAGEREQWALATGHTGAGYGYVPDLTEANSRQDVLALVANAVDTASDGAVRNFAAQLWALRGRISQSDLVVMPLKNSPHIAIGKVTGDYAYLNEESDPYRRHVRPVDWIVNDIPRTVVKQDLLYSLGAFSTICEMSRNDAAWRLKQLSRDGTDPGARSSLADGRATTKPGPEQTDELDEASDVAQPGVDIERYATDLIASRTIETFAGHGLADLVAAILEAEGFTCDVSPEGPDQGVDIIAGTGVLGLGSPKLVVQVKSEAGQVGVQVVQQLQGAMATHGADQGLLVAWGGITRQARQYLSTQRFAIKIWHAEDVLSGVFRHYRELPAAIQTDLPLKQVWTLVEASG